MEAEAQLSRPDPEPVIVRTAGGQFAKGSTPNPGGRAKRTHKGQSLPELARAYTDKALRLLARVVDDEGESMPLRVTAAEALLRRGWGDRPSRGHELPEGVKINVQQLVVQGTAMPGILQSPITQHLSPPAHDASEIVDVDGTTVEVPR